MKIIDYFKQQERRMTGVFAVFVGAVIVVLAVFKTIGVGSGVVFPDWLCHILLLCGIWAFLGLGGAMFLYSLRYFILLREKQMGEGRTLRHALENGV